MQKHKQLNKINKRILDIKLEFNKMIEFLRKAKLK